MKSKEFIQEQLDEYTCNNNQNVPFDKIEEGYIQCVRDPRTKDRLITVQIVKPQYNVDNEYYSYEEDETLRKYNDKTSRRLDL